MHRFSAADVYIGAQIGFGMRTKSIWTRGRRFKAYHRAGCSQRPAYKRSEEQSARLLAQMKVAV